MLYRKQALAMLLALIFLSFFGTPGVSAAMFPDKYDWRYRVISNLLSPRDNPHHYWLSACGVSLAALLMLPLAGYLRRHLEITSPLAALVRNGAFVAGFVALICACLVVPQHVRAVLGIRRLQEPFCPLLRRIHGNWNVVRLVVRMERLQTRPVLDFVFHDGRAAGWTFL
jgi:hypothetical protein